MNIAVNARLLLKDRLEGIGWFSYETLRRITQQHPEHQFFFIFDRPFSDEFVFGSNVHPIVAFPPTRHPILWYLFFEFSIPKILKKYDIDLFVSTDGWLSLRTKVPQVDVIHDLNFEHFGDFIVKPIVKRYYKHFFPKFAERAARIATVSEFSKQDIHALYGVPLGNIDVVYNGANELFQPISEAEKVATRAEFAQGSDYFVFVSAMHKRKNLVNLFRAFDLFKERTGSDVKLVLVGSKVWWRGEIEEAFLQMRHKDSVIFLGRLQPQALKCVLASAIALVYASFFEGFGIPILEAFCAETAVITSNTTSMPEIAGDAALLVNPYEAGEIAEAMCRLFSDGALRTELIGKGRIQRQRFSWDATAAKLWGCIERVINDLPAPE